MTPKTTPLLTVCVIARNEEANLEGCLTSTRPIADEMIVVDTGSSDATADIAGNMGARLESFRWIDDFSAARNFAIEQVRTPWVLMLDADERISEYSVEALRAQLSQAGEDCNAFSVRIDNQLDGGGVAPFRTVRLFRNRPELRYHGMVHEEISSSLAAINDGNPVQLEPAQLVISHDGYVWEAREQRGQKQRNTKLLRRALKGDPRRALIRFSLGRELLAISGERVFAGEGFDEALELLQEAHRHAEAEAAPLHLSAAIAATLASVLTAAARPLEALELLRPFQGVPQSCAEGVMLQFARGRALLAAAGEDVTLLTKAEQLFGGLSEVNPEIGFVDLDVRIPGLFALERRAEALGRLGRKADALKLLEGLAEAAPEYGGLLVRRAQVHLLHGEVQEGLQAYVEAMRRDGHDPEAWLGTARVVNALGQTDQAIECAENALKIVPMWREALLELALFRLLAGRPQRWLEDYSSLRDTCPEVDVSCLMAEVLQGSAPSPLRDWPKSGIEQAMVTITRGLAMAKRQDLLDRLKLDLQAGAGRGQAPAIGRSREAAFVLLSHPRSGTNNLLRILNQHPEVACIGEIFNPQDDGPNYVKKLGLAEIVEKQQVSRLREVFEATRNKEQKPVVGFKLFCYQLGSRELDDLVADPEIPKILLHRTNLLQAYISWDIARRTQQWRLHNQERSLPDPFEVDIEQARKWLQRNRRDLTHCRQLMHERGVPVFECHYENLFTQETLNRLFSFLRVGPLEEFENFYRVQRSAEAYERILNRQELEQTFGESYGLLIEPGLVGEGAPAGR